MPGRRTVVALAVTALAVALAPSARAADPGLWRQTAQTDLPLTYYQGVTNDDARRLFFDGPDFGLWRTDMSFQQTGGNADVIPPDVHAGEGYNHIGDITWDAAEGGRILLPLECYYPETPNGGNSCQNGSIGVADPDALTWRYHVHLDPAAGIKKAMWAEVSPDGSLVWTSSGSDLLAYRTADVSPANAAHAPSTGAGDGIEPVQRLTGVVPESGITGAAFVGDRLFVAGSTGPNGDTFQVWSIDLTGATPNRLEIERTIVGESEGLTTVKLRGGELHWLIQPYNEHALPTYGITHATLLSFRPAHK
jgi:hypothetical protein